MSSKFLDFILGYESSDESFSSSKAAKAEKSFSQKVIGGVGYAYSKKIFNSRFANFLALIRKKLTEASIKSYGILLLSFGIATLFANLAEYYFRDFGTSSTMELIAGAVVSALSFPLLFIDLPFAESLQCF